MPAALLCAISHDVFLFFAANRGFGFVTGVTYFYYAGFVEADEMSYGDNGLKMEGLLPSLALFLLTWTVSFTAFGHTLTPDA